MPGTQTFRLAPVGPCGTRFLPFHGIIETRGLIHFVLLCSRSEFCVVFVGQVWDQLREADKLVGRARAPEIRDDARRPRVGPRKRKRI